MKTAVSLDAILDTFSAEDRAEILQRAEALIKISRLAALRESIGWTQATVADHLATSQANISQLEKQTDPRLSSLRRYVEALGGDLKLFADMPGLGLVDLSNIANSEPLGTEAGPRPEPKAATRPVRR